MIRAPPRSTRVRSSAASDVYKRQGKTHAKSSCTHDHDEEIAADRGGGQNPTCADIPQLFERDEEQCGERRIGEGLSLDAYAVKRLVANHCGGSTDVDIEIDPDAFADAAPPQPEEDGDDAGHDHMGQRDHR